jgi:hypothetical protein
MNYKITQRFFCQDAKCNQCVHGNGCDLIKQIVEHGPETGFDNLVVEEITSTVIFKN